MNLNISAYIVFTALMVFIIVYVGRYFYTNGRVFIVSLLNGNVSLADSINRLLLVGYYLLNIGYAFLKLKDWKKISTLEMWLSSLALNMGTLILILAFLHYVNMLAIYYISKSNSITHKSFQS
jgi:hypothetical protein